MKVILRHMRRENCIKLPIILYVKRAATNRTLDHLFVRDGKQLMIEINRKYVTGYI